MIKSSFDSVWENEVFSKGRQNNRYPFSDLVSHVFKLYGSRLREHEKLKVLELGCGTGNNLLFFAREGFETYGIEGSKSACELAKKLLEENSLKAQIVHGDFVSLPFSDNFFDLIVDREAVYCNRKDAIAQVSREVQRCLKSGGRFLAFTFSDSHDSLKSQRAERVEPSTYTNFSGGAFEGAGTAHFFSEDEVRNEYFKGFEIEFMLHHKYDLVFPETIKNHITEYITCGKKI